MNKLDDCVRRDYFLERANRVCEGVTANHYERWKKWSEENNQKRLDVVKFISDLTRLSYDDVKTRLFAYHMETKNGKKVRVDDHYEKIKIV